MTGLLCIQQYKTPFTRHWCGIRKLHSISRRLIFTFFNLDYDSLIDENEEKFDGTRVITYTKSTVNFESSDFSLAVLVKTTTPGTVISKTGVTWSPGNVAFTISPTGTVSYQINGVGTITGTTKVNDAKWHEVAVVYSSQEKT